MLESAGAWSILRILTQDCVSTIKRSRTILLQQGTYKLALSGMRNWTGPSDTGRGRVSVPARRIRMTLTAVGQRVDKDDADFKIAATLPIVVPLAGRVGLRPALNRYRSPRQDAVLEII